MAKKLGLLLLSLFFITGGISLSGQVTIGNDEKPLGISVLELISNDSSIPKGLRLPQLSAAEISVLTSNINLLPSTEKSRANGMMVFNTTISCVMVWNGYAFKSLCGDVEPAEIKFDCSEMAIFPNSGAPDYIPTGFQQGKAIDGSVSYISLPATVIKSGTYNITATTGNGYSFSTSGTFLDVGNYVLKLAGIGTPIMGSSSPQHYDQITLSYNNQDVLSGCEPENLPQIPVAPAVGRATYTINCSSTAILGTYVIDTDLNASNYITVQVNVTDAGFYSITAEAAGMQFNRSGEWPAGTSGFQTVALLSTGRPTQAGVVPITITGETAAGNVTCDQTITVSYRAVRVLGLGSGIYQPGTATSVQSARAILESAANFGASGTFPVQSISITNGGVTVGTVADRINTYNPDIIVIGYNFHTNASDNTALVDFVQNKKGVLIAMTQDNGPADAAMVNAICGSSITMSGSGAGGSVYQLPNIDNEILNGPFGDIRGNYWGDDAGTTYRVNAVPAGAVSLSVNREIFMYNNFIWIGDGGFAAGNRTDVSSTIFPCMNDSQGRPIPKTQFSQPVYNSVFYANAIAWAIKYVQENR